LQYSNSAQTSKTTRNNDSYQNNFKYNKKEKEKEKVKKEDENDGLERPMFGNKKKESETPNFVEIKPEEDVSSFLS
jgi:hypothetical protein